MINMTKYRTGEEAPESGIYEYAGPTETGATCAPTSEERQIPLFKGETFPPVKSCDKDGGAFWKKK